MEQELETTIDNSLETHAFNPKPSTVAQEAESAPLRASTRHFEEPRTTGIDLGALLKWSKYCGNIMKHHS